MIKRAMVKTSAVALPVKAEAEISRTKQTGAHLRLIDSLRLRYQPIIQLSDQQTDSLEVLVRAINQNGDLTGPESIVEAMTGPRESMDLTGAIMQRALVEIAACNLTQPMPGLAFNLPLDAMLHPDLVHIIETIRARHALPAQKIRFELTERHPVEDIKTVSAVITMLRDAGYVLALDDITPTMPNLAALLTLPLHAIKLDRSIVISGARADNNFIKTLATHAKAVNQQLIAEGIETQTTLARMKRLGVTHGQGYLFAHPLPAGALNAFLNRRLG